MVKGTKAEQRGPGGRAPREPAFYCILTARGPCPQLDAPPPERSCRALVGSGPLELEAGATQTRCDVEAGTELGGTRGSGTESVRSGGREFCLQFPIQLAPVAGDRHLIVAAFPTTPQEKQKPRPSVWCRRHRGRARHHRDHCRCGLFSVGAIEATSKLLDLGHWCVCGCAESFTAPLVKRGKLDKSMARLDAQEIKHRANPQSHDNPAPCRNLGHYLLLAAGSWRFQKEPGSMSVSYF